MIDPALFLNDFKPFKQIYQPHTLVFTHNFSCVGVGWGAPKKWHIGRRVLKSEHLESCRVSNEKCTKQGFPLYSKPAANNQLSQLQKKHQGKAGHLCRCLWERVAKCIHLNPYRTLATAYGLYKDQWSQVLTLWAFSSGEKDKRLCAIDFSCCCVQIPVSKQVKEQWFVWA